MKKNKHSIDSLMKKALRNEEKPDEKLVEKVKRKLIKKGIGKR